MKLFVIGATGRTGEEIVQQALARGHHVTAFVRSPEAVTLRHERLGVLEGNVTDEEQLSEAMQNHDAVVSALGPRRVFKPSSLLHDSALATIHAMQPSGVRIGLSVLSCEIICAIRLPWKKSCNIAVSIGRSLVLRVSHRNNT